MHEKPSTAARLIERLALVAHPEGGHFKETYRSQQRIARTADGAERSASTAIYYLLRSGERSTWHRIRSDEVWHFYDGSPLHVHVLEDSGALTTLRLGNPLLHEDATFQAVVPAGTWFAAQCAQPHSYSLVGCTVAPGFEFEEFEIAEQDVLLQGWPQHAQIIERLR